MILFLNLPPKSISRMGAGAAWRTWQDWVHPLFTPSRHDP